MMIHTWLWTTIVTALMTMSEWRNFLDELH